MSSDPSTTEPPLRARTLEILWHCNERNEEAERLGMHGGGSLIEGITSIDYSPELERIVTTGGDKCLRLWQFKPLAVRRWLSSSLNDMTACCVPVCTMQTAWMPVAARWSPRGEMIASAHCDGKLCLWWRDRSGPLFTGKEEEEEATASTTAAAASEKVDGMATATGAPTSGGTPQREEWKNYRHLSGHMNDVYDIAFSPDSRYLMSCAGDGSVVLHDLEGSAMPVVQLVDQHRLYCRGVAWDPWNRYLHSFGGGPPLQCQEVLLPAPRTNSSSGKSRRVHVVNQRKCQGDFLGECCALSFRRLSWSPDGLFLAAPYGKVPRAQRRVHSNRHRSSDAGSRKQISEADIFDLIDAKRRAEGPQQPQGKAARTEAADSGTEKQIDVDRAPIDAEARKGEDGVHPNTRHEVSGSSGSDSDDDESGESAMVHCVNIYARDAPDRLAARLCLKGYNEIRGVLWAPCFLEPLAPKQSVPLITRGSELVRAAASSPNPPSLQQQSSQSGGVKSEASDAEGHAAAQRDLATQGVTGKGHDDDDAEMVLVTCTPTPSPYAGAAATTTEGRQALESSWGPPDYRMALAAYTTDSVVVYTTDSPHRHSDFSDLHMRSITDIAWAQNASFLLTASLDGYVSVISFGQSLSLAHRLPLFSPRPVSKALSSMLEGFAETGRKVEDGRSTRPAPVAAAESARESEEGVSGVAPTPAAVVVVKKKKKSVKNDAVALSDLDAILNDVPSPAAV